MKSPMALQSIAPNPTSPSLSRNGISPFRKMSSTLGSLSHLINLDLVRKAAVIASRRLWMRVLDRTRSGLALLWGGGSAERNVPHDGFPRSHVLRTVQT